MGQMLLHSEGWFKLLELLEVVFFFLKILRCVPNGII